MLQNRLVFGGFNHYIFVYDQNRYDIRNQHQKLTQITYFLKKKIFVKIVPVLPFSFFWAISPVVPPTCGFEKKEFFSSENMLSESVFDADSEYHIYFGRKQKYNG
jgi:hypothetical protein